MQAVWSPASKPTALGVTQMRSSNYASRCISMVWVYVALNASPRSTTLQLCTGFEAGEHLRDAPESEEIPEVVIWMNCKPLLATSATSNKLWIGCAVNHKQAGILAWVIGDRSGQLSPLWRLSNAGTVSSMSRMAGKSIQC